MVVYQAADEVVCEVENDSDAKHVPAKQTSRAMPLRHFNLSCLFSALVNPLHHCLLPPL
jgi:hypothetical protein